MRSSPRRVFLPVHYLTGFGGLHDHAYENVRAIRAMGWECLVMCPAAEFNAKWCALGADLLEDDMHDVDKAVARAVECGPFDLIHAHPFQARRVGLAVAEKLGVPALVTFHGQYEDDLPLYVDRVKKVLVVSSFLAMHLRTACPEVSEKLVVWPNGVDTDVFFPSLRRSFFPVARRRCFRIVLASRLDADKLTLLEAVQETWRALYLDGDGTIRGVPIRWRIAGAGGYGDKYAQLRRLIARINSSHGGVIEELGWIRDPERLRDEYVAADLVVASGRGAAQALASGARVIAVASRGYVDIDSLGSLRLAMQTNFGGAAVQGARYSSGRMSADIAAIIRRPRPQRDFFFGLYARRRLGQARLNTELANIYKAVLSSN